VSPEDWEDIQYLLRFGPGLGREARAELPVGVATWLMPAAITFDHIKAGK
jgi:hypothetical protein